MAADHDDFGVLLAFAHMAFLDGLQERLAEYEGLTPWSGAVLRAIDDRPMSLRDLAERLQMSSPGALKVVDPMVASGYLERVSDPQDGRVRAIALTPLGREVLAAARRFHAEFEAKLADDLGERAVRATRRALEAIVARNEMQVPPLFRPPRRPRGPAVDGPT